MRFKFVRLCLNGLFIIMGTTAAHGQVLAYSNYQSGDNGLKYTIGLSAIHRNHHFNLGFGTPRLSYNMTNPYYYDPAYYINRNKVPINLEYKHTIKPLLGIEVTAGINRTVNQKINLTVDFWAQKYAIIEKITDFQAGFQNQTSNDTNYLYFSRINYLDTSIKTKSLCFGIELGLSVAVVHRVKLGISIRPGIIFRSANCEIKNLPFVSDYTQNLELIKGIESRIQTNSKSTILDLSGKLRFSIFYALYD